MPTGDLNNDGIVDAIDLSIFVSRWGSSDPDADLNNDGIVDAADLSILVSNWGEIASTYQVLASWSNSVDTFDATFGTMYTVENAGSFGERLSWTQATGQSAGAEWNQNTLGTALATQTLRWVAVFSGWPTESGFSIAQGVDETSGSANRWRIDISTGGLLRIRDAGGTVVQQSDDPIPLNTEVRFEAIRDDTLMTVHAFSPATATLPLITISGTVGSPVNRIRIGQTFSSTVVPTFTADEIVITNHAGLVGPPEPAGPPTVPEPPTNVIATAGVNEATISWVSAYDGGSPITEYEVTVNPSTGVTGVTTRLTGSNAQSFVFTGLAEAIDYSFVVRAINSIGSSIASASSNSITLGTIENPPGMELYYIEDFNGSELDTTEWQPYNNTYGDGNNELQHYRPQNIEVSGGTAKFVSKREDFNGRDFTSGFVGTRELGRYFPRFGRYEIRAKLPHGQGLWPAFWLRHRDGSNVCEVDVMEYFHTQVPGRTTQTLHRDSQTNVVKQTTTVENPELISNWHTWAVDILPENTNDVRFRFYTNGIETLSYLDVSPNWVTRHPGEPLFDIAVNLAIGGNPVGHPDDDPLGRLHLIGRCAIGWTTVGYPDDCAVVASNGWPILRANFPETYEVDYIRVWQYIA